MNKIILYVSGAMTAAQESFVKEKGAEIRNQFVFLDKEKDYEHVFVRKEVPGFRDCENAVLFGSVNAESIADQEPDNVGGEVDDFAEVVEPAPKKSTKKKSTKKVVKD